MDKNTACKSLKPVGEPSLRCKLRCNFCPSVHSFPMPPYGNGGFRKRAERDAVTSVDAGGPAERRGSREHEARARHARRNNTDGKSLARPRRETATPTKSVRTRSAPGLCTRLHTRTRIPEKEAENRVRYIPVGTRRSSPSPQVYTRTYPSNELLFRV